MSEKYISLDNLKEYNKQMKETYIEPLEDKQAELDGKVTIVTFDIINANTTITLQNLEGMTKIDWSDGEINNELTHKYSQPGLYQCKIYDVTSIGERAFFGCSSLTSVEISDSVTSISGLAFCNCDSLTNVKISDSVTSIGYSAFYYCSSLTSVVISDSVTSIDSGAFAYCSSLTSVEIPDSVTSIGENAFYECTNLTSVEIGDSVTYIRSYAFYKCSSLTSVDIPDSVTSIGEYAFQKCVNLIEIEFKNSKPISLINLIDSRLFDTITNPNFIIKIPYGSMETYIDTWGEEHFDATENLKPYLVENPQTLINKEKIDYYFRNSFDDKVLLNDERNKWLSWLGIAPEVITYTTTEGTVETRNIATILGALTLVSKEGDISTKYLKANEDLVVYLPWYEDTSEYLFTGWSIDDILMVSAPEIMPYNDLVLYAHWEPKPYTLTIKQEGVSDQEITFGIDFDYDNGIIHILEDLPFVLERLLPENTETEYYYYQEEIPEVFELKDYTFTIKVATTLSIADALMMGTSQAANSYTEDTYLVNGTIVNISDTEYGDVVIADAEGNTIYVHGMYSADAVQYNALNTQPVVGDVVKLQSAVGNYKGTPQLKNAIIINFSTPEIIEDIYKAIIESFNLSVPTDISEAGDITVATIGTTYTEVAINWTSSDATIASINDNVITFTLPAVTTDITLTATLTCGEVQYTKTFVVNVKKQLGETETEILVTFGADNLKGTQYADETYVINENLTISSHNNGCHFTSQLRIFDSVDYDGWVILQSPGVFTNFAMNAGYKKCDLLVYGSTDGVTWQNAGTITTTSTGYLDYELDIDELKGYTYLKLDASGAQLRIKNITATVLV